MKATRPRRESADASVRAYRKAEATPVDTAPAITELAGAALSALARDGTPDDGAWRLTGSTRAGTRLEIRCSGPDLPVSIPERTIHPTEIPKERPWVPAYRLAVAAPLVTFDIAWAADAPLRIMQFSRGDWEQDVLALAG